MTANRVRSEELNRSAADSLRPSDELRQELLGRLKRLNFLALEECLCRLFLAMGYERAAILGRKHFRGKNSGGGADLEAFGKVGVSETKALIQVKRYDRLTVPAKYVDELRGAMLRQGAETGIIVTTSAFSPVAVASAKATTLAPIRLIDGDALVKLLIRYRVGVRPGLVYALKIDAAFFAGLPKK